MLPLPDPEGFTQALEVAQAPFRETSEPFRPPLLMKNDVLHILVRSVLDAHYLNTFHARLGVVEILTAGLSTSPDL